MSGINKEGLGIVAAVLAVAIGSKIKEGKGRLGSFNDEEGNQIQKRGEYLFEMMEREKADPFLGQQVGPYRGQVPMNPEYMVILDLVDTEKVPLPDELITTPQRPYGPRNSEALFAALRPDPTGIIRAEMIASINKKSHFFAMVEAIKPMIESNGEVIDLNEQGEVIQLLPAMGRQLAPMGAGASRTQRKYRINLFGQASNMGRPLQGRLPFSNLIYTFEMYGHEGLAKHAYEEALRELNKFMNMHQINQRNARRLK